MSSKHIAHNPRRFLSELDMKAHPSIPTGTSKEKSLTTCWDDCRDNAAAIAAVFTVSVAPFPGVTEPGEMLQSGMGDGPLNEHASATVPEKPLCAVIVKTSLACPPRFRLRFATGAFKKKSGPGSKVAVTDSLEVMMTLHTSGSMPVHAPLYPANTEVPEGLARMETLVPPRIFAEQVLPQSTFPNSGNTWVMVPAPFPALVTVRVKFATTVVSPTMELFASLGSDSLADTFIELVITPAIAGMTTMETWASEALSSEPILQVTMRWDWTQLPWEAVAETKVVELGSESVNVTPVASCGPMLRACDKYVKLAPMPTGSGDPPD